MSVLAVDCGLLLLLLFRVYIQGLYLYDSVIAMNTLIAFPSGGLHGVRDMVPGNEREVGALYYFLFFFFLNCVRL